MRRKTQIVVIGLVKKGDTYLLTKRKEFKSKYHDLWQLPGGGLEWHEKIVDCLRRELREETGIEVKNIQYIPAIFEEFYKTWHGVFFNFTCEPVDEDPKIVINDEASDYGWYTLEEARKMKCLPGTIHLIEESLRGAGKRT
jgi:ADP-ribose pyrophosphatase YjhB (NUDIX family)